MAATVTCAPARPGVLPAASAVVAADQGSKSHEQRQLPEAGFDGILVAAIGTGLTGAGWLLMLTGSRRFRRRSR